MSAEDKPSRSVGGSIAGLHMLDTIRAGGLLETPAIGVTYRKRGTPPPPETPTEPTPTPVPEGRFAYLSNVVRRLILFRG